MTALDDIADVERPVMHDAAQQIGLDTTGSRLISASSRLIWHLPVDRVALTITRPGSKTADDIGAEAAAVRSATAGGVRTPPLLAEPTELADARFALPYRWIDGRAFESTDWPAGVVEAAKLARSNPEQLRQIRWPADWPNPAWETVLGQQPFIEFCEYVSHAEQSLADLLRRGDLTLCHGDLQPANFLIDELDEPWLIDMEYACLAPPAWDAAKIHVLANRFGDPEEVDGLLDAWLMSDLAAVDVCAVVQQTQIVGWLAQMALLGTPGARAEARRRASSLDGRPTVWRHLSTAGAA